MTWWQDLSISFANIIAGFAGGVVNAFVLKRSDPWSIIGSVVVGALTANYLASPAQKIISIIPGLAATTEPIAAFLVGMGGMGLVQGLIEALKKWRPTTSSNGETR